jgi:hypothetical protein
MPCCLPNLGFLNRKIFICWAAKWGKKGNNWPNLEIQSAEDSSISAELTPTWKSYDQNLHRDGF